MANQGEFILNHNIVGYLTDPPSEYGIFKSMVRVLNSCKITKALKENPVMYRDLILEFWANAKIVKSQTKVESIMSKVKETEVIVTEDVIRRVLEFGDQPDFPHAFADNEVEETLRMMSYEGDTFTKFYKKIFPPYWRFLIHTFQMSFAPRSTGVDVLNKSFVHAIVAFVRDLNFNFSYFIFDEMKRYVKKSTRNLVLYPRFVQLILNELYPYIPRSGDSVDLKGIEPDIFRRMCVNRRNKDGLFTGRYPLVKFGRFANIEGETDNVVSAGEQDEPDVGEKNQSDVPTVAVAPAQTVVIEDIPEEKPQPTLIPRPPVSNPFLGSCSSFAIEIGSDEEDEPPQLMTDDEITNMLTSEDFHLPPAQLEAEFIFHDSLPPLNSKFSTFEELQEDIQETFDLNQVVEDPESDDDAGDHESSSSLIPRKRKRSETEAQKETPSVVEPSSTIPEVVETFTDSLEKGTEAVKDNEKENECVVDMELDQSSIQEKIVEKEAEVEKEAVVETENVEATAVLLPPESTPTTAAEVPPIQDKASGKAIVVEDSISEDVPGITLDQMFQRAQCFPVDPSVGGSGAGGSGVSRSPQRPISPSFPANDGGSDSDSDFDDADNDFEDTRQGRFLRKVIEKKDILLGTMDVRLHEAEEEIASLKLNLGNLTASFIALQQLLCQQLGDKFNFDSIPLPTVTPVSQPPSSSTPAPSTADISISNIVNRFPTDPEAASRRQKQRITERRRQTKERIEQDLAERRQNAREGRRLAREADMVIMKNTDHRAETIGRSDCFIVKKNSKFPDRVADRSGIKVWGWDEAKKMYFVKRNSGRIEHYELKVDFLTFTKVDLRDLVNARFWNPTRYEQAYHFRNMLRKQADNNFKGMNLAQSWTRTYKDVMVKDKDTPFKNVFWPPTKKVRHVPIAQPLPNGVLRNFRFWAYDHNTGTTIIRLTGNQQYRLVEPNDLFRFDESDIRVLSRNQIQVYGDAHEGSGKEYTAMVIKIIENRLWVSAREGADIHPVPLSRQQEGQHEG